MDFADNKLSSFTKKIIDLIDQPNMQPDELKAYFDSSPEEVRQAHNSLCDALTTATSAATAAANLGFQTTAGVPADNVQDAIENVQEQLDAAVMGNIPSGSVTGDKLAQDVRDRFAAIESAATGEANTRASGDSNLQNQINAHSSQIAAKTEIITGTYTGDGQAIRLINLGRKPKAVYVCHSYGITMSSAYRYGGLALDGHPAGPPSTPTVTVTNQGFQVYVTSGNQYSVMTNAEGVTFHYIAWV